MSGEVSDENRVVVLGAGSWGTALARHVARDGMSTLLWARDDAAVNRMRSQRENARYLPGRSFPPALEPTADLIEAVRGQKILISAVPAQASLRTWARIAPVLDPDAAVLCAAKGLDLETGRRLSAVFEEVCPNAAYAVLAGPSFAAEVADGKPTAVVVGAPRRSVAESFQRLLAGGNMRVYVSDDVAGLELGGALKNVMAIACGCADGLSLGHNARAAIITRGLAELTRLAVAMGAEAETLAGLGGMGDLVLTCTGDLSRNRRVGLGLAKGKSLAEIQAEMGQVAEGVKTVRVARTLGTRVGVELPITEQVHAMLYEGKSTQAAVRALMGRDLKPERS